MDTPFHTITSGARTVAHISHYFQELQAAALDFAQSGQIAQRGYFRPGEEERARQLQVSYWQTRGALYELIESLKDYDELQGGERLATFLVAYAGALLLVDGARFLRENFHQLTVVREKLDEADPSFGIPPRMYDTIQRSLTSTRHAWHLYHATEFFDQHQDELRALARDDALAPVMATIDRLDHRVRVSASVYANARLRVRARGLARRIGRDLFGRALYGLQKFASSLMADRYVRRDHHPQLPEAVLRELRPLLTAGDVLIVRKEYALTNYFLPGYWPHAALYLGDAAGLTALGIHEHKHFLPRWPQLSNVADGEPRRVLEAMKDGVRIRSVASPFASDSILVVRPRIERADLAAALARGMAHEGKAYDFDFDFNRSDRLVCTEVVFRTYEGIGGIEMALTRRAGRNTLGAGDIVRLALAGRGFDAVAVYAPAHAPDLLHGPAGHSIIAEAELGT